MKFALGLVAFVLLALFLPFVMPGIGKQDGVDPNTNLPWQIEVDAQGSSRVFGIQPGKTTLEETGRLLGEGMDVAIVAAPGEDGALEAYYGQLSLGFVLARVILTVDVPQEEISAMRQRASSSKYMESTTRKIMLHPDDLEKVKRLPIRAISVIPNSNLDEATVVQRFGQPSERLEVSDKRVHLLYPAKGLDVIVDADGKELLQYVAPNRFAVLREPLNKEISSAH